MAKIRTPKAEDRKKPEIRRPKSDVLRFGDRMFLAGICKSRQRISPAKVRGLGVRTSTFGFRILTKRFPPENSDQPEIPSLDLTTLVLPQVHANHAGTAPGVKP